MGEVQPFMKKYGVLGMLSQPRPVTHSSPGWGGSLEQALPTRASPESITSPVLFLAQATAGRGGAARGEG